MKQSFRSNQKYTISSKAAELYLQADGLGNGSALRLHAPTGAPNQLWQIQKAENGQYRFVSVISSLCMDVISCGTENGSWVHQWEYLGAANQLWSVEEGDDGACKIKNSGKCLDIVGMNAVSGAHLQLWTDVNGENQQWVIRPVPARRAGKKAAAPASKKAAASPGKKAK